MNFTTTYFPYYTSGTDAIEYLPDIVKTYGGTKLLFVGGKTALSKSKDKIIAALAKENVTQYEFMWYGGECTYNNVEKVKEKILKDSFDVVIGVGGGKALDTAKVAAANTNVIILTIPTIASTCAATTSLSVVYSEDGTFKEVYYLKKSPSHAIIDIDIIANSPWKYLWAGIGDTLAKYYEVNVTQGKNILSFNNMLGKKISILCLEPLMQYGSKALEDIKTQSPSFELEQVVMNNIVSTGFVSFLVDQKYNGALSHGLFYGLTLLEEIEKNHLHGEVISYGVLVLLKLEGNEEDFLKLYSFYKEIGLPTSLKDLGISLEDEKFDAVLEKALNAPDMQKMPITMTRELLLKAINTLENS